MQCRDCKRYVSTYRGKWSNLCTLKKQRCKAKANTKRQAKNPSKLAGGEVQPAPPPGSKGPHRGPRANKRQKLSGLTEEIPPVLLDEVLWPSLLTTLCWPRSYPGQHP
eukprot:2343291-Amphidinium_carterae.1